MSPVKSHFEARPRVLLVDDEPFNLDVLAQELEDFDLEIETARNGEEALAKVTARPPDMIFLDLMMPVMDGFAVLELLQDDPARRGIPVVIVSAASDTAHLVRGIELGAIDFLPKPFEPAVLHARLQAGLERKRRRDLERQLLQALARELEIGREIQAGFLPETVPQPAGWRVDAHFQAAREVAGDFYDVFPMEEGRLGILVGDVTDKGVGSALFMALFRSLLRAAVMPGACLAAGEVPGEQVRQAVALVNRYICEVHRSAMYATLFFGVLDPASGELEYVSAGHDPAYVLRDGVLAAEIMPTGPAAGMFAEAAYRVGTATLLPGDALVCYSDGIPDAENAAGERWGQARFRAALEASGREVFAATLAAVRAYVEDASPYDDLTLVVLARDGP